MPKVSRSPGGKESCTNRSPPRSPCSSGCGFLGLRAAAPDPQDTPKVVERELKPVQSAGVVRVVDRTRSCRTNDSARWTLRQNLVDGCPCRGKGKAGSFKFFDELMLEWGWMRRNL